MQDKPTGMTEDKWRMRLANAQRRLGASLRGLLFLAAVLWAVEIADWLFWRGWLDSYGIQPRTWQGLGRILAAPFLHVGFEHLAANTLPLLVLGWLVMLRRTVDFWVTALVSALISGLGIWLLGGENTVHLGASGVIFGLFGYLLARGFLERSVPALVLAAAAGVLYGGMIWGAMPGQSGVSWLGHLFGLLGGIVAAFLLAERRL